MRSIWKRKLVPKSFDNWDNYQLWNTYYYAPVDPLKINMAIKYAIRAELIKRNQWNL